MISTIFRAACRSALSVLAVGLALNLAACSDGPAWETKDISGLMPNLSFALTEANRDRPVTAGDYRGKFLLLYFGYTNCPDVCPTTLSRLNNIVTGLDQQVQQMRILFVSVDPDRDSLQKLKEYSAYFGPEVVGLRGSQTELQALTKMYRVTYGYDKPDEHGNYEVSHSSAVYVFDALGAARLLFRPTDSMAAMSHDLKRLLDGSS